MHTRAFVVYTAQFTCMCVQLCTFVFSATEQSSGGDGGPIKAPAPMWRCSRIMHLLRDLHPTLLSALEGIVDQVYSLFHLGVIASGLCISKFRRFH